MDRSNKKLKGFTLLELITVIAIIAVMAAILVPSVSSYIVSNKIRTANTQAQQIFMAAQEYLVTEQINGTKPSELSGSDTAKLSWIVVRTDNAVDSDSFDRSNKTVVVGYDNINDSSSDPNLNFIEKDITTASGTKTAYPMADGIESRLEPGFEGSWMVAFYPKTFTVAYAVYNNNYEPTDSTVAVINIGANGGVIDSASVDDRLYKSEFTMGSGGSTWEAQESDFLHPNPGVAPHQYTGQFPIPGPNIS